MRSHGIVIDHKGLAWFNADGGLGKMDTKTEKLEWFDPPSTMARVGGTLEVWTPYWRTNRIARLQFRTNEEMRAIKAQLQAQRQ